MSNNKQQFFKMVATRPATKREEVADIVKRCADKGVALPAGLSNLLDEEVFAGSAMHTVFKQTTVRDILRRRPDGIEIDEAKHVVRSGAGYQLSLDLFKEPRRVGDGDGTEPYRLLNELRRQWRSLLVNLSGEVKLRAEHVLQVQLCPDFVMARFLPMKALCFSVSRRDNNLPRYPVKAGAVNVQVLEFNAGDIKRNNSQFDSVQRFVEPMLRDAELVVEPSGGFSLRERDSWKFRYIPSRCDDRKFQGKRSPQSKAPRGKPGALPIVYRATLANGVAMHEAVESAAVSWEFGQTAVEWPELLVEGHAEDLDAYLIEGEPVPDDVADLVVSAVATLREASFSRDACRNKVDTTDKADPLFWLQQDNLPDESIRRLSLVSPESGFDGIAETLGSAGWKFVRSVVISGIVSLTNRPEVAYFRVRFATDPAKFINGKQPYVRFGDNHFGRSIWLPNGKPGYDSEISSIQVLGGQPAATGG